MSGEFFQDELMVLTPHLGKSAYAYAVEGGYTGTEEEFAVKLAFLMNGTVVGYVEGSTIVLTGDLAPGTYTFAYDVRKDDGSTETVTIGTYTVEDETAETEPTTYAVTFVADGVTVDTVTYEEGATSIEEPDVPAKDGYTGAWEAYDITNGGNITVNAVYTEITVTPSYTNLFAPTSAKLNQRINSSKVLTSDASSVGKVTTNFMDVSEKTPFTATTKIYIKGATFTDDANTKLLSYKTASGEDYTQSYSMLNGSGLTITDKGNGVISSSELTSSFVDGVKRFVLTLKVSDTEITEDDIAGIIITVDEPIE